MWRRSGLIMLTVGLAALMTALPSLAEVKWAGESFDDILKRAKSEDKHVLLDFYTVWCSPCKKMDKETYKDPKASAFINGMIAAKYDSEKGAGIKLSQKYRVSAWPTTILLGPDGEEVDRYLGYLGPEEIVKVMKDSMKGVGTVTYYRKNVDENPNDPEAWKRLGIKYVDAGMVPEAKKALKRFGELAPNAPPDDKAQVLYKLANAYYEGESFADAAKMFKEVIEKYGESAYLDDATIRLARCHHELGDTKKCISTYLTYVGRHPDDPKALNSFAWFCATRKVGLDEALPIAIKAVKLTEREPGYLDTLAELYYARGEFDEAIKIGKEAAEKDPTDSYFTDQVKKFEKAKKEAESRVQK